MRRAEDKYQDALDQIAALKSELSSETRNKELSERDVANYSTQVKDLRDENGRLRDEVARLRLENDNAKTKLAAFEDQQQATEAARQRDERAAALQANESSLIQSLRRFGSVAKSERGIVLTLPENMWAAIRSANFAPNADGRLTGISDVLTSNPDYRVTIESHTDSRGTAEELESLTNERSKAIAERLTSLGIADSRIESKGLGAALPVAPNTTNASRAKNRRVQLILVPNLS